ncbi:hypothetical protein [Streptomyces flavofungini]|uniref:Secreted protein n=1 Tax=Streptomyces flavofungini TaxID=68200 RepID=A0ABS0WYA6_9ACTN|nr:hypothetical protein [Streptomyces flavofungini]MBJ3805895.1 hypothetical protein [Streptomyces flavofungini]GHC75907.1 hypothetical protein GCM10010349_55430 [Streptomyces flavofungini]
MRALPVRRIATSFLCTALLLGTAGPVYAATHDDTAREAARTAPQVPVPGADALLGQVKSLGDIGGVIKPVTDLLQAVLKADNGAVPAADLATLTSAVTTALDAAKAAAPKGAALPETPQLPAAPQLPLGGAPAAQAPMDLKGDALAALQKSVEALVKAVTSADVAAIAKEVPAVLTGLVNFAVATLLGGGLPVPNLPGLPALPKLPVDGLPLPKLPV